MSNLRGRTTSSTSLNRLSTSKTTVDTNQNKNIKKKPLTKPAWDATNTDLNQHKPTIEEIDRRKQSCKSKNIDVIKFEKQKQEMLKNNKKNSTQSDSNSQLALLKEILYDDEQLKNIILKSDSTLKVVKDFFNEQSSNLNNINTKQAKINLTLAPNVTNLDESNLPYNKVTKNDQKSTIITAKCNNLNNISDNEDEKRSEEEEINNQDNDFNINIKDLEECLRNLIKNKSSKAANEQQTPPNQLKSSNNYTNSINDTDKVSRLKSSLFNNEAESNTDDVSLFNSNLNSKQNQSVLSTMNDEFKKALIDLENKLNDFEKHIGKQKNADSLIKRSNLNQSKQVSYNSSYTLTLIQIVSSLLDYLKDAMIELNFEKLKQAENNKQLDIHRKLIDGLTTEVLTVKEQNSKIINDFSVQNAKLIAEMDQIKMYLKASISINQVQAPLPNTFIDTKPKISAFTSQPQLNMENLIRPVAQVQQNQQSFLNNGLQQSTSFNYASLTDFRAQNNSLEEANKLDKFSERLNAMLQTDLPSNNLLKSTSVSNFPNLFYNSNNRQIQNGQIRPLSATSHSQSNLNDFNYEQEFLNRINQNNSNNRPTSALSQSNVSNNQSKQLNYEFNSQIDDLKTKNIQVQQRLRQLQEEQGLNMIIKQEQPISQLSNSDEIKQKNDALEKLKQEQLLLKEQINMLNKQRESAQQELEILSVASSPSSNKKNKNFIQNSLMKHLNEFNANYTIETNSPGLSPIQPENLIVEGGLNLEVTPTRNNDYKMK